MVEEPKEMLVEESDSMEPRAWQLLLPRAFRFSKSEELPYRYSFALTTSKLASLI
jgi:hypothetical protein